MQSEAKSTFFDDVRRFLSGTVEVYQRFFAKTYPPALVYAIYMMVIGLGLIVVFPDYFTGIQWQGFDSFFFNHFNYDNLFQMRPICTSVFFVFVSCFALALYRKAEDDHKETTIAFLKRVTTAEYFVTALIGLLTLVIDGGLNRLDHWISPLSYDMHVKVVITLTNDLFIYISMFLPPVVFAFYVCRRILGFGLKISLRFIGIVMVNFFMVNAVAGELQNLFKRIIQHFITDMVPFMDIGSLINIVATVPFMGIFILGYAYVLIFPAYMKWKLVTLGPPEDRPDWIEG